MYGDWHDTGTTCHPDSYTSHYTASVDSVYPRLTHLRVHSIPPSGTHEVTKTSNWQRSLAASVRWSSGATVSTSVASKIIGKASAKTNLALRASGQVTTSSSVSVTDWVSNPTGANASFPFYRGWKVGRGSWRYYFCEQAGGFGSTPWHVMYKQGTWRSFASLSDGAVRCGAGTTNVDAVGRLAYAQGCS